VEGLLVAGRGVLIVGLKSGVFCKKTFFIPLPCILIPASVYLLVKHRGMMISAPGPGEIKNNGGIMKTSFSTMLVILVAAALCTQGATSLTGKVTDQSGTPLSNVVVWVCNEGLSTITDYAGIFNIQTTGVVSPDRRHVNTAEFGVTKTRLSLALAARQTVTADLFDLRGRHIAAIVKSEFGAGIHNIALPQAAMRNHVVLLRVTAGSSVFSTKYVNGNPEAGASASLVSAEHRPLGRVLADPVVDTLAASRYGYAAVHILLTSYSGDFPIVLANTFFLAPDTGANKCHDESYFPPLGTPQIIHVCASIAISRTYADSTCMRLLRLAETLPPDTAELFKVMPPQVKQEIPPAEKNGVWWYQIINGARIAYAITDKAVKYYADSTLDKIASGSLITPQMTYNGDVKYYENYGYDSLTYSQVYVAQMSLYFRNNSVMYFVGFSKQRIVVFNKNGQVLKIYGDSEPTNVFIAG
jgi:hypothetical protein